MLDTGEIYSALSDGKIEKAIQLLQGLVEQSSGVIVDAVTSLSGRFQRLQKDQISGVVTYVDAVAEENRIVESALQVVRFLSTSPTQDFALYASQSELAIPNVRALLKYAFTDDELQDFCQDYFAKVYNDFGSGQSKSVKIRSLIDYVVRHDLADFLLLQVNKNHPAAYQKFQPYHKLS